MTQEVATLGGGCFWCLEAVYDDLQGVTDVVSGYTGGHINNPTYRQICTGTTGHAEVVKVTFDSDVISYRQILDVFFTIHDPTTLNRQGADVGTQYRSAIYVHSAEQRTIAEEALQFATGQLGEQNRHGNHRRTDILPCRGLPPRVLCQQPQCGLLPSRHCAQSRQIP
jgi:peptide-methionine (S)-S-oxide reductase